MKKNTITITFILLVLLIGDIISKNSKISDRLNNLRYINFEDEINEKIGKEEKTVKNNRNFFHSLGDWFEESNIIGSVKDFTLQVHSKINQKFSSSMEYLSEKILKCSSEYSKGMKKIEELKQDIIQGKQSMKKIVEIFEILSQIIFNCFTN